MANNYQSIASNFRKDPINNTIVSKPIIQPDVISPNSSGIVPMWEIPEVRNRVKVMNVDGTYKVECFNAKEITEEKYFYVDYSLGDCYFHKNELGKAITIVYRGIGNSSLYAGRVYTKLGEDGSVTETIQDIVTKGRASIDFYNATGSAIQLQDDLEATNIVALATNAILQQSIVDGGLETIRDDIANTQVDVVNTNNSLLDITYNIKTSGAKGDGITDDTVAIKTFFDSLIGVVGKKKVIFQPNKTYCVSNEIEILSSDLEIDFNGSVVKYTGSTYYDYALKCGVFKFRSPSEVFVDGVLEFDPLITTTLGVNGQFNKVSTLKLTQEIFDKTSVGQLISFILRTKIPPYTSTESKPTVFTCAKILSKDIATNKITIDYYSPYDWSPFNNVFPTNKITLYNNGIKNIRIKNYNFTATSSVLADISPLSFSGVENIKVENCKFERNLLPCIHFNECYNFQVDSCEASNPITTDSGKGYLVQNISCHFGRIKNVIGNGMRHLVDFSGGWDLLVENAFDVNTVATNSSLDCHGQGEHSITYRNCKGSFCFGNGRLQFESINANILIDRCDVVSLQSDCSNDVSIKNSTINFTPTSGVGFKSLMIDNCKILMYDVASADTYIKSKYGEGLLKEDTFVTIINSIFTPMSKTTTTAVGIKLLNFGRVTLKNNIIKSYTHLNTLEVVTCTKAIIQGNTIDNCIITCDGEFDLLDNEITIRSNKSYILIENGSVTGYKKVNIDGNTIIMNYPGLVTDDIKFFSSNSQGNANPLHIILLFNNNYFQNITKDCTYFIQSYANLTWHVYSSGNIARQSVLNFSDCQTLFPVATGIVVIP